MNPSASYSSPPSASSCERVLHCPASHVISPRAEESGEQAERGNEIHEYLRRVARSPAERVSALQCVPLEWRTTAAHLDLATALNGITVVITESAYAIDASTGGVIYLGENIDRKYNDACRALYGRDLTRTEFCVSLDVEGLLIGGTPCAADWKTGIKRSPCSEMMQMKLQSYVLIIKYDAAECEARVIYVKESGAVVIDDHVFSRMELDALPGELMGLLARVDEAQAQINVGNVPNVHIGAWCTYCPAVISCPGQTALVKAMLPDLEALEGRVEGLSVPALGVAWGKLKQIQALSEKLEKAMKLRIYQEEVIPADEGYEYRVSESSKSGLNADSVRGLLTILDATQEQIESVVKVSKFPVIRRVRSKQEKV